MIEKLLGIDTYIAVGILILAAAVVVVSRMNLLPKKSLPFVIAGIAALFGLHILRRNRTKALQKQIKKREKKIEGLMKVLDRLKKQYQVSDTELEKIKAELETQKSAHEKEILNINNKHKSEEERINKLSGEDLHREYVKAFSGQ